MPLRPYQAASTAHMITVRWGLFQNAARNHDWVCVLHPDTGESQVLGEGCGVLGGGCKTRLPSRMKIFKFRHVCFFFSGNRRVPGARWRCS